MTKPPPQNLMDWSKGALCREVERLRAITREHAESPTDAPTSGGAMVDMAGDPYARGSVVLDVRKAVLLDELDVCLVDTKQDAPLAMMMMLAGRVNYETRRTKQGYLFGPDGAAGLVTQLMALASRAGGDFLVEFDRLLKERFGDLP